MSSDEKTLRVLTLLEANSLTGVAKAFVEFCAIARIDSRVVSFHRKHDSAAALEQTLKAAGAQLEFIPERFPFDTRVVLHLDEVVTRLRPDIIESHSVK